MSQYIDDKKVEELEKPTPRPLGNLVNIYAVLVLADLAFIILGISTQYWWSFWLFIIAVIGLPIIIGAVKLLGFIFFLANPKSSSQQLGSEVVSPLVKSKLIWILILVTIIVYILVYLYINH